jgi:uncharacterized protein YPO0396
MTTTVEHVTNAKQLKLISSQWIAESLQMVNWGGFEGHHTINLASTATLISGSSGTGKSTLMDAYTALMMDSSVPFNGASNDSAAGRARGAEQRSVLSYARGKVDVSRESGTGQLKDEVLRGRDSSTWSAVAITWRNGLGERFTAFRLYYIPATASEFREITTQMGTIDHPLDLSDMEEFAADHFPRRKISARFEGLSFYDSYQTFTTFNATRLGIGTNGDGAKALKLLARIQVGRQVSTVDELYKTMVLEEPGTFKIAERAIDHFDDLRASYETMKTAESQVKVLTPIPDLHASLIKAEEDAARIDTYKANSPEKNTPFALWFRRVESELLGEAVSQNREECRNAKERSEKGNREVIATKSALADVRQQLNANGGNALESVERAIDSLQQNLGEVKNTRTRFDARTKDLNRSVTSLGEFNALRQDSEQFIASFPELLSALEIENSSVGQKAYPLKARDADLRLESESLSSRTGLVPRDLHAARQEIAQAIGVDPEELPFVAELLDMAPGYDDWRQAAELALGGFAVTMLVDQSRLSQVRREINSRTLKRRLQFEGADLHQQVGTPPSVDTLPGRFITKDTAFTAWLMQRLEDRFNYICVDSAGDLDAVSFGLTITGQTKQKRRGAHGGHGAPRVIGFSNAERLVEIAQELALIQSELAELEKGSNSIVTRRNELMGLRDAHIQVTDITWNRIDVATAEAAIQEKKNTRDRLLKASDMLTQLRDEEIRLNKTLLDSEYAARRASEEVTDLDSKYGVLVTREDEVSTHRFEMEGGGSLTLTDSQTQMLTDDLVRIEPNLTPETFGRSINALRAKLAERNVQFAKDAESATKALETAFAHFQTLWPKPNLGTGMDSYQGYKDILDDLLAEGLHVRRERWSIEVNKWSGEDLLTLNFAYDEAIDDIKARLEPINEILSRLPFGPGRDRLHITLRHTESADIGLFRKELKSLSSGTTSAIDYGQAEDRFRRLLKFIDRIRRSDKTTERDRLLDVRKHVHIEAERRDTSGRQLGVYASLGGKSGGETQELVAFIVGAALRYQLGDADSTRPRYAPVFLDEGFIKSDSEFAGRAVSAWIGLGFQMIIGAPNDKVTAIEPYMDLLLQVTKNQKNHSHVSIIQPHARPTVGALI